MNSKTFHEGYMHFGGSELKQFAKVKTNAGKVMHILSQLEKRGIFTDVVHQKNNEMSRKIRQKGNELFALKEEQYLITAMELYNQSICEAVHGSEDFGIAFANRSAVYLELGKHELCLKDIQTARDSGYPQKLMNKLKTREAVCKASIMFGITEKTKKYVSPIEGGKSHAKPFLERRENEEFGKFVVTTQLVNPGEILIVEDTFTCLPIKDIRFKRCWNCATENNMYLFPCKNCTQVMYCRECLETDQLSYHQFECPIIENIISLFEETDLLGQRAVIKGVLAFGSLTKIGEFLAKNGKIKVDAFSKVKEGFYENEEQKKFHQVSAVILRICL